MDEGGVGGVGSAVALQELALGSPALHTAPLRSSGVCPCTSRHNLLCLYRDSSPREACTRLKREQMKGHGGNVRSYYQKIQPRRREIVREVGRALQRRTAGSGDLRNWGTKEVRRLREELCRS